MRNELVTAGSIAVLALAACSARPNASVAPGAAPLGTTKAAAIEVCMPKGERAYLEGLRCDNGEIPSFERFGSVGPRTPYPEARSKKEQAELTERALNDKGLGPGEADIHIIDGFKLTCGQQEFTLYLDMYHCNREPLRVAPPGFKLREGRP
jgi:hypothetical protein